MEKLINLRHLDIRGTSLMEMPIQMSRLKDLQLLTDFIVGKDSGSKISELGELSHLRGKLTISGLENVMDVKEASEANLKEKGGLKKLALKWSTPVISGESSNATDMEKEKDVILLEKLQPPQKLTNLTISGYRGTEFPNWLGDDLYRNIVSIGIGGCAWCRSLPSLGQLPFLKGLKIWDMERITHVGREFYGNANVNKPFRRLEDLSFANMPEWEVWNFLEAGEFSCLLHLSISRCPKLKGGLPRHVPCLATLEIYECGELEGLEELMTQQLPSQKKVVISGLSNLTQMPPQLCRPTSIQNLMVQSCQNLTSIPDTGLPPTLVILDINDCPSLVSFPIGDLPATLKRLDMKRCRNLDFSLKSLPLDSLPNLESLLISGCTSLETFSHQNVLQNLKHLELRSCKNLKSLPHQMHTLLPSLEDLVIWRCPALESFPEGGLPSNLLSLEIENCPKIKWPPLRMQNLPGSLQTLAICDCPELEPVPDSLLSSSLLSLEIGPCQKLAWNLQGLHSLESFSVSGDSFRESFPGEMLLPTTFTSLHLRNLPNLKSLDEGLLRLTALKLLEIHECNSLLSLPEDGLPCSLSTLALYDCPQLIPHCRGKKGKYWSKIAHIPSITIDGKLFFRDRDG